MTTYIVKRQAGYFEDCLTGFDVIWGPIWCVVERAVHFPTQHAADVALCDAANIMRPRPWCVPHYGAATTLWVDEV